MEDAWACFGSDSDEDVPDEDVSDEPPADAAAGSRDAITAEIREAVNTRRRSACTHNSVSRVWIGIEPHTDKLLWAMMSQFQNTRLAQFGTDPDDVLYDIVVSPTMHVQGVWENRKHAEDCRKRLVPGGIVVLSVPIGIKLSDIFPPNFWNLASVCSKSIQQRNIVSIASLSTLGNFSPTQLNLNTGWVVEVKHGTQGDVHEQRLLEAVTISLTSEERCAGKMSATSIKASVAAMQEHGLCIIRGLFRRASALAWGEPA